MKKPNKPDLVVRKHDLRLDLTLTNILNTFKANYSEDEKYLMEHSTIDLDISPDGYLDQADLLIEIYPTRAELDEYELALAKYNQWLKDNPKPKRKVKTKGELEIARLQKQAALAEKRYKELWAKLAEKTNAAK